MSKSILIVEDDQDLSSALKEALEDEGFTTVHATKFSDALYKAGNQRFDCILCDLNLEVGSGLKFIQQVRSEVSKETVNFVTPIVLMSGALDMNVVRSAAPKVQAVLAKPFDSKTLIVKIKELIENAKPKAGK